MMRAWKITRPVSAIPPSFLFAPAVTLICLCILVGGARPAAPPDSGDPRPPLYENDLIFSALVLRAPRRTPNVATCLRRALVAARNQRRKRWQVWGWEPGLAIVAAVVGPIRTLCKMSRASGFVAKKGGYREGVRGTAEITTSACAIGPSSVRVTSMRASQSAGVMALSRASAPPA